jgi:hypothetical protein
MPRIAGVEPRTTAVLNRAQYDQEAFAVITPMHPEIDHPCGRDIGNAERAFAVSDDIGIELELQPGVQSPMTEQDESPVDFGSIDIVAMRPIGVHIVNRTNEPQVGHRRPQSSNTITQL